jgi:hypothetical protein
MGRSAAKAGTEASEIAVAMAAIVFLIRTPYFGNKDAGIAKPIDDVLLTGSGRNYCWKATLTPKHARERAALKSLSTIDKVGTAK